MRDEPRNTAAMVANTILVRTGWIFKTESVIIPAFLDSIAGSGWMRGLLPVLNRLGQSVVPFLLARRMKLMPRKKFALLATALAMAAPFLAISGGLTAFGPEPRSWFPVVFLTLYTVFFAATGMNMLAGGTLSGKLIRANRRGRFMALGTMGGTIPACICAWFLLPTWLGESTGYAKIFGFTGVLFAVSALAVLWIREPADDYVEPRVSVAAQFRGAWQILREDRNYRLLVIVGALFTTSLILLPHYQALGRERLGLEGGNLMVWVVYQNVAVGIASVVMGPLADRYGNRFTLRIAMFISALAPPLALAISHFPVELGRSLYTWVFVGIGLTPIVFRLTANYILEIAPEMDHPRYLSLAQLCNAVVILTSPIFGLMIDVSGFEGAFGVVTALMVAGGLLTFRLTEPRARR
ncbi:MAG: MFS transporter [Myxococcota bacterium]